MNNTFKIQINGRVQGVGFRPFVFNLAKKHNLKGSVSNNASGVIIYIASTKDKADLFLSDIIHHKPEVAIIVSHTIETALSLNFDSFLIIPSDESKQVSIPLTPDFAICESCKSEIKDPENRRYQYPFTTCVHCGPRYSITNKFPFERKHTSLSTFEMCPSCNAEYADPSNRRFHSQTNSCSACGISLNLVNSKGALIKILQTAIIPKVGDLISDGNIIAIKNTNGFLLCCDATNSTVIRKLRQRKKRPNKPFAVLYPSIESVEKEFDISVNEANELQSRIAPILIVANTERTTISTEAIAPNLSHTGVMLPSSSLIELIMHHHKQPIIATSGNMHGSPIISKNEEAQKELENVADYFLIHDLEIVFPQDDSVVKFEHDTKVILRRSRGFAPNHLESNITNSISVLAMGAHLKSTFTFVPNTTIYVSQYFGNLDSYEVLERYKETLNHYTKLFNAEPKTILIDKHPQYQSSLYGNELAEKWKSSRVEIQHHKAHFTSVLGEHNLFASKEKILGVVWDGTGWGEDGAIWGGEFFIYKNHQIERLAYFEYFDWLANDKMANEPRLPLLSLLNDTDKEQVRHKFSSTEWKIYNQMLAGNNLKTSSVGRLFDAVASALEVLDINTYEAEAAMRLENVALHFSGHEPINFLEGISFKEVPTKLIIEAILKNFNDGVSKERLAYSFIYTLAKSIIKIAKEHRIKIVACSGGVFQNTLLLKLLNAMANEEEIALKLNYSLSANDENISFGQLMYYLNINF